MWLIKVFSVIYFTAVCAAQDPQDVTSVYNDALVKSTVPPAVTEPPVPSLQLKSGWSDVFPSERVEFSCSVTGSTDWTFTWYINQTEVQDTDPNVSLSAGRSVLTITAATQKHSGQYSCKGHHKTESATTATSKSRELIVDVHKPKPTVTRSSNFDKMFPNESITFTCTVHASSGWEYLWYHNGNEIPASNKNTYTIAPIDHPNSGQYRCKAKRGDGPFYTEESETTTLQVSDPPKPSLKPLTPWLDVFEEDIVALSCEVNSSGWTFTWYQNQKKLQSGSVLYLESDGSLLNITSAAQAYQGVYACKAHLESRGVSSGFSNTAHVKFYDTPKPTLSKDPAFNSMYVGETVNFTCNVDVSSGWEYQLYKNGDIIEDISSKSNSIHLGPSDGGIYSCMATRNKISTDSSQEISQLVLEIPVPSLKVATQWMDVFATESVKLSCGMDSGSDWTFQWYKDGQKVQADKVVSFDSKRATLSINSASAAHAGRYTCTGHLIDRSVNSNFSSEVKLTVYEIPVPSLKVATQWMDVFPTESVKLSCGMDGSYDWTFQWYKDGRKVQVDNVVSFDSKRATLSINSASAAHAGRYTCTGHLIDRFVNSSFSSAVTLTVYDKEPKVILMQDPDHKVMFPGESVSFACHIEVSSGWKYLWYKDGGLLTSNKSSFRIDNTSFQSNGTYECMAIRDKTMYNTKHSDGRILHMSEIPVPSLKLLTPWFHVFTTESVKLSCGMDGSYDWSYKWYKDGQMVQGDTVSFDSNSATLSINSASAAHEGNYTCMGSLKDRSVNSTFSSVQTLKVYDTKPGVILMQDPIHNVMHTGDSVSFSCHINVSSEWEYLWYKDGSPLPVSENNHNITSVVLANTGLYTCQVKRGVNTVYHSDKSQAVRLNIKQRPQAEIALLTGWSEVFSTDTLVLKCGVQESEDMWNYTWFKEGEQINLPPSEKHTVTPQNDHMQSMYTCKGNRNGRPSYSRMSDSFKTKNLLLKRRVLLSISGCILFGIIAVFLGCIVLRVIRKPANDEDRQEEENLFLTMAQLKDCPDARCPLVEYITDASLNASPKEGDENGTICSETTPLPISSQEDQAVTTESEDTTEKNGGLASFKQ